MATGKFGAGALLSLLILAPSTSAQAPLRSITLYSEPNFQGDQLTVTQARERIQLGWQIRSVRMPEGDRWLVCPRVEYEGNCVILIKSDPSTRFFVGSVRPRKNADLPPPAPGTRPEAGDPGPSLRGAESEYFATPMLNGQRALSCDSGGEGCARDAADAFCNAQGWPRAVFQRQEQIDGRHHLTDVLCARQRN